MKLKVIIVFTLFLLTTNIDNPIDSFRGSSAPLFDDASQYKAAYSSEIFKNQSIFSLFHRDCELD
jgi:hypothetical protein